MDNGLKTDIEKEKVHKYGKMVVNIKVTGKMIKQMEKEDLYMQMVMYMKVNGSMIKHKDEEHTSTWMGQSMLETGKKIDKMDMVLKPGRITLNMKEIMKKESGFCRNIKRRMSRSVQQH